MRYLKANVSLEIDLYYRPYCLLGLRSTELARKNDCVKIFNSY